MDWVTLTRQQVDNDALPRVCMACGKPATCSVNETFEYSPEWVEWLYFAGYFPGLIADNFFGKEMRVSCPFCHEHQNEIGFTAKRITADDITFEGVADAFVKAVKDQKYPALPRNI